MKNLKLELSAEGAARVMSVCRSISVSPEFLGGLFDASDAEFEALISAWRMINHYVRCGFPDCDNLGEHPQKWCSVARVNDRSTLRFVTERGVKFDVQRHYDYEAKRMFYELDVDFARDSHELAAQLVIQAAAALQDERDAQ